MCHVAIQQSESMRAKFMAEISIYDPAMVDESGFDNRISVRRCGYSLQGMRPVDHRRLVRGVRNSAIPVMSTTGIHDIYLAEGSVNGERFEYFVKICLLPVHHHIMVSIITPLLLWTMRLFTMLPHLYD